MARARLTIIASLALLFSAWAQAFAQTIPEKTPENIKKFIAVLKSDASDSEKAAACRQLAAIGDKEAIEPLAALLGNEKLSHMARYGLETIPDPAVDEAFRTALTRLKGKPLVGVIGSVGVRRDPKAVLTLSGFLGDPDPDTAQAAARALGSIGNSQALRVLTAALDKAVAPNRLSIYEGLFRIATGLRTAGKEREAAAIYRPLARADVPHQVRAGAVKGLILTSGKDGIAILSEYLKGTDEALVAAAASAFIEMPGAEATAMVARELPALPEGRQILLLQALGKRGDQGATPALLAVAGQASAPVRVEAFRALTEIGDPTALPHLVKGIQAEDREVSSAAVESLAAFPGKAADDGIAAILSTTDTALKVSALQLLERRKATSALPAVMQAANQAEPSVQRAGLKAIGKIGGATELPFVLTRFEQAADETDVEVAETALVDMGVRAADREKFAATVSEIRPRLKPAQQAAALRVIGVVGGKNALAALRTAIKETSGEVRDAGVRSLAAWKTAEAAPDLLALAKAAGESPEKFICLRGYLSLAGNTDLPVEQRVEMTRQAAPIVKSLQEKRLLLSVLGNAPAVDTLQMAVGYLSDSEVKAEAVTATLSIGDAIAESKPVEVTAAMDKVLAATENKRDSDRAKTVKAKARPKS